MPPKDVSEPLVGTKRSLFPIFDQNKRSKPDSTTTGVDVSGAGGETKKRDDIREQGGTVIVDALPTLSGSFERRGSDASASISISDIKVEERLTSIPQPFASVVKSTPDDGKKNINPWIGPVHIFSDSEYSIKSVTGVYNGAKNRELIDKVTRLAEVRCRLSGQPVQFHWHYGHCGILGNERADTLASAGALASAKAMTSSSPVKSGGGTKSKRSKRTVQEQNAERMRVAAILRYLPSNSIVCFADGSAEPSNPGPCGAGYVVCIPHSDVAATDTRMRALAEMKSHVDSRVGVWMEKKLALGHGTNNIGELEAMRHVLLTVLRHTPGCSPADLGFDCSRSSIPVSSAIVSS